MVVTRKPPALPTPTSRTNSQQTIPRIKKQTPNETTSVSSPLASSGTADELNSVSESDRAESLNAVGSLSKKANSKGKKKGKKSSQKGSGGFVELLTRAFLLFFTIYTLSVCPTDEHMKSPVCHGLHEYRRLILEPYLLPPIRQALAHPTIAPYVNRAKPYADRSVSIAKPIVLRIQKEWNERVVPQWHKRVVPQWHNHAVPAWNKYAVPHIERAEQKLDPYVRTLTSEYERNIAPHLRAAVYNLHKWRAQAHPYVLLAAQKTYSGYQKAKPYAIPMMQRVKSLFADLIQLLVAQRRKFVDPHLMRIWEGVVELSGGKPATSVPKAKRPVVATTAASKAGRISLAASSAPAASSVISSLVSTASPLPKASDTFTSAPLSVLADPITPSETLPATVTRGVDEVPDSAERTAASMSPATNAAQTGLSMASVGSLRTDDLTLSVAAASSSATSMVSSLIGSDTVSANTALVGEPAVASHSSPSSQLGPAASSLGSAAPVVGIPVDTVVISSFAPETAQPSPSSFASMTSDYIKAIHTSSVTSEDDDDIDLNEFYAELGLDKEDEPIPALSDFVPAPEDTETEEEKAEKARLRQIEITEKRADITGRHSKWEQQLEEVIANSRKALRKELVAIRKTATSALKESKEIRKEVETLVEEAEKFLKGADKYLANLKRESRRPEEKRTMWDRVMEKVDDKFGERLSQTEAVVNGWYNDVLNLELAEVRKVSDIVRDIADRAQADIGLDYAWLDDVTYQDWQRYHDLVRASENFTQLALSIQNGSHPSPPINPVLPALTDLQAEVQDVVVGFETRLRRVKRNGDRAFGAVQVSEDEEQGPGGPTDETVSILPIQPDDKKGSVTDQPPADLHHIVIGRSKEEVVEALNRAAEVDPTATSNPEDRTKDAEEVVGSLVSQVEQEVASSVPQHLEL